MGSDVAAGSDDCARFLLAGLPGLLLLTFFGCETGTGSGTRTSSSGIVCAAFTFFAARVKTKSPSCSSYAAKLPSSLATIASFAIGRDARDVLAKRLLFRRSGWLLMLKTWRG